MFIGSGEYLVCKEVCRQVVLSMGGANIILGIQWLGKLGPVMTDHKELTMEFNEGDKLVRFQISRGIPKILNWRSLNCPSRG